MFQFWIYDDLYFFTIQLFLYITWNSAIKTNFLLIANKIDFIFCSCRFNISLCRNKISVICFLSGYNCLYMYLFCISICIFIRIRPFSLFLLNSTYYLHSFNNISNNLDSILCEFSTKKDFSSRIFRYFK